LYTRINVYGNVPSHTAVRHSVVEFLHGRTCVQDVTVVKVLQK